MILAKTQAGQEALKDRHGSLSPRQRSAFILFDGKRSTSEILIATAALGITQDDIQAMMEQDLLAPLSLPDPPQSEPPAEPAAPEPAEQGAGGSGRSPKDRYQAAYLIATELTARLGLRGFRLNLAVEAAGSFDDLAALAPKIREAVGDGQFRRLHRALFD